MKRDLIPEKKRLRFQIVNKILNILQLKEIFIYSTWSPNDLNLEVR